MSLALRENPGARPPNNASGARVIDLKAAARHVATITVERTSPEDIGIREVFVSVDGEQIAILSAGESVSHEIPAGPHTIRAHNTLFWKKHQVVLQPGEHARFKAINRAGWGSFGFLMVLGASPIYLTFERVE
jgi:hypothetical protein